MEKRGAQVTVFILIGVCIVAAIILVAYYKIQNSREELGKDYFIAHNIEPSVNDIEGFSLDCLKQSGTDALELIGIQGGYYNKPELNYDLSWAFIPYYYYKGSYRMPSQERIESELGNYVNDNIVSCLDEIQFSNFDITYTKPTTRVSIQPTKVVFTEYLTIAIDNNGKTIMFEMQGHPISFDSLLFDIEKVAEYITNSHKEDPDFICINCVTQLAQEKSLYVDFIAFEPDSTLVMIIENSTQPDPYIFEFLNKYDTNKTKV